MAEAHGNQPREFPRCARGGQAEQVFIGPVREYADARHFPAREVCNRVALSEHPLRIRRIRYCTEADYDGLRMGSVAWMRHAHAAQGPFGLLAEKDRTV